MLRFSREIAVRRLNNFWAKIDKNKTMSIEEYDLMTYDIWHMIYETNFMEEYEILCHMNQI